MAKKFSDRQRQKYIQELVPLGLGFIESARQTPALASLPVGTAVVYMCQTLIEVLLCIDQKADYKASFMTALSEFWDHALEEERRRKQDAGSL